MNKRFLSILLLFCILLTNIYIPDKAIAISFGDKNIYEGIQAQISFELIKGELPPGTKESITIKGQKLKLNTELWIDKGIVVYGDHLIANPSDNDYKKGTQNPSKKPYYNYGEGEYRYHGYSADENKYTNIHFIDDENIDKALEDKQWIYNPWETSSGVANRPIRSGWNDIAIGGNQVVKQWINKAFDWQITNTTNSSQLNKEIMGSGLEIMGSGLNYLLIIEMKG